MRGTRAKQLRRMAEDNTINMPKVEYGYVQHTSQKHFNPKTGQAFPVYQIKLMPRCTRTEYKKLKREYSISRRVSCQSH